MKFNKKVKKDRKMDISHFLVIALGFFLIVQCSVTLALIFIIVSALGTIWFLATICPHCNGFGSRACPSGYGLVSSRYFKRPDSIDFKKAFRRNIFSVALQWFIPFIIGIWCLIGSFDVVLMITFIIFVLVAFIWLPAESKKKGCKNCPQKNNCGWVSGNKKDR